jgi:hypothetical protein
MKKYLVVLLSLLFVMGISSAVFASDVPLSEGLDIKGLKVTFGGEIEIEGIANDNLMDQKDTQDAAGQPDLDDSNEFYEQEVRVHFKAEVNENTAGYVEIETGSSTADHYEWGCDMSGATGTYKKGNCKPSWFDLRQAYITHQGDGLGVLSGFKAGHMDLHLGNGHFFDHTHFGDDALLFWLRPADGMEIDLIAIKIDEVTATTSDDADAYVGVFSGNFGSANVSADLTYVNDDNFAGVPLDFLNIGVRADAPLGPVTLRGDLEIQTGKAKQFKNDVGRSDMDLGGHSLMLGVDFNAGPVTITVEGAYGTGDDPETEDDYEGFVTTLSNEEKHYAYVYDYNATTAGQAPSMETVGGAASTCDDRTVTNTSGCSSVHANEIGTGLNNTQYLNVGVSANAGPDIKLSADLFILAAMEEVAINGATDDDGSPAEESYLGTEVDGRIEYQIDTNLVYYIEAGILFVGDAYDYPERDVNNNIINGQSESADDAWSVKNGLVLEF